MKLFIVCLFMLSAYVLARPAESEVKYTSKYDNIDIDSILKSKRLLDNYVNCIMDRGKCTAEGLELKKTLPDAIETECNKCSEKQKEVIHKVVKFVHENRPDVWADVKTKFDPDGTYEEKFKKMFKIEA